MSNGFIIFERDSSKSKNIIRHKLQKALSKELLIEEVDLQSDFLKITEANNKDKERKLKKVRITNLNYDHKILKIWRINLELDPEKEQEIPGWTVNGKTVEIALLVLQKFKENSYTLNIILIELKSNLVRAKVEDKNKKPSTLENIAGKFQSSMNRMYLLLAINDHFNSKYIYEKSDIVMKFRGIVFYLKNKIGDSDIDQTKPQEVELYDIFTEIKSNSLLSCKTLMGDYDKIKVKFISKDDSQQQEEGSISVRLEELLNF